MWWRCAAGRAAVFNQIALFTEKTSSVRIAGMGRPAALLAGAAWRLEAMQSKALCTV